MSSPDLAEVYCHLCNMMKIKSFRPFLAAAGGVVLLAPAPFAQSTPAGTATAQQPPTIQQQNEEMIKELRAIRQLLERLTQPQPSAPAQPTSAKIVDLKGYALGKPDAPLTMVEFTDLQCPFCRQFHVTSFEQLKKEYIDTGKLRYFSRDFPLESLHPFAMQAARAAKCAADEGKFWE